MTVNVYQPGQQPSALSKLQSVASLYQDGDRILKGDPLSIPKAAGDLKQTAQGGVNPQSPIETPRPTQQRLIPQNAIGRQLSGMQPDQQGGHLEVLNTLRNGEQALNQMPQEIRNEYTQPLFQTMMAAYRQYGPNINRSMPQGQQQ